MRPGFVAEDLRGVAAGVAQVNAVQAQQREAGRIGPGGATVVVLEGFMQIATAGEGEIATQLPVVEVAGDDHRGVLGQRIEQLAEQFEL
ncbi:hypothetical protein D3C84_1045630 [compost metagenome]